MLGDRATEREKEGDRDARKYRHDGGAMPNLIGSILIN